MPELADACMAAVRCGLTDDPRGRVPRGQHAQPNRNAKVIAIRGVPVTTHCQYFDIGRRSKSVPVDGQSDGPRRRLVHRLLRHLTSRAGGVRLTVVR